MKLKSLIDGHNWVYLTHILFVSPLLFYVAYTHINDIKNEFINFIVYIQLAMALIIPIYHGSKLYNNIFI